MENNCDDAAQGRDKEKFVQTVRAQYTPCATCSRKTPTKLTTCIRRFS